MQINITDEAKLQLREVLKESKYENPALRVFIAGMGWGGPRLGLTLDESKDTKDNLMDIDKIKILFEDNISNLMGGNTPLTIDFIDNSYGKGFTVNSGFNC